MKNAKIFFFSVLCFINFIFLNTNCIKVSKAASININITTNSKNNEEIKLNNYTMYDTQNYFFIGNLTNNNFIIDDLNKFPNDGKNPKPGTYNIKFHNKYAKYTQNIIVKHDFSILETKNFSINKNSNWQPFDGIIQAKDEDNKNIDYKKIVIINKVDSNHPGTYYIEYQYILPTLKILKSTSTVTVIPTSNRIIHAANINKDFDQKISLKNKQIYNFNKKIYSRFYKNNSFKKSNENFIYKNNITAMHLNIKKIRISDTFSNPCTKLHYKNKKKYQHNNKYFLYATIKKVNKNIILKALEATLLPAIIASIIFILLMIVYK